MVKNFLLRLLSKYIPKGYREYFLNQKNMLKPTFLTFILFGDGDFLEKHAVAKKLGYKMFNHNNDVYSSSDCQKLFTLNQLY